MNLRTPIFKIPSIHLYKDLTAQGYSQDCDDGEMCCTVKPVLSGH